MAKKAKSGSGEQTPDPTPDKTGADTDPQLKDTPKLDQDVSETSEKDTDPQVGDILKQELDALTEENNKLKEELIATRAQLEEKPSDTAKAPKTEADYEALISNLEAAQKEAQGKLSALKVKNGKAELAAAEKNDKRPVFTDARGLQYRFKSNAPKTLNIDGRPMKLKDIIADKEVMLELIYGNSNFVEQKNA